MSSPNNNEDDEVLLPGFRFHPTDEELVGFYLLRKVEKRPVRIEIIKQIDIYKYDPWDIPKVNDVADKEWYFFCRRGRKYRNSVRPNRVTGSGFWKATGIDRPIYSTARDTNGCNIGLKKSLVYYQGSAGKGTKTDWMMHEFRLPTKLPNSKIDTQEAEVWTICRIFKRNSCVRKSAYKKRMSSTCSSTSDDRSKSNISGITTANYDNNYKPLNGDIVHERDPLFLAPYMSSPYPYYEYDLCREESWDELRPIVNLALIDPSLDLQHH